VTERIQKTQETLKKVREAFRVDIDERLERGLEMNRRIMRRLWHVYAKLELVVGQAGQLSIDKDRRDDLVYS